MSSADTVDLVDQNSPRYACPVFKANPSAWLDHKCIAYGATNLKETLIRHHILTYHYKENTKIARDHPRYLEPEVFDEIRKCKEDKSMIDGPTIWNSVYKKLRRSRTEYAAAQDPYWTPHGLHATLGLTLRLTSDARQLSLGNDERQKQYLELDEQMAQLQKTEDVLSGVIDGVAIQLESLKEEVRTQLQLLRDKLAVSFPCQTSTHSSMTSSQPGDSQSTQGAGTIFLDQHELTESSLDVDMFDAANQRFATDSHPDQTPNHNHEIQFSELFHIKDDSWEDLDAFVDHDISRQLFQGVDPVFRADPSQTDRTSNQTTLADTRPAISFYQ